jgi:hypothetical protein
MIHSGRIFVYAMNGSLLESGVNAVGATWGRPVGARVETANATFRRVLVFVSHTAHR